MSLRAQAKELRAERVTLANEAQQILDKASAEDRELTQEETEKFDRIHTDIEAKRVKIERLEKQLGIQDELAASRGQRTVVDEDGDLDPDHDPAGRSTEKPMDYNAVIKRWGLEGAAGLTEEERKALDHGSERRGSMITIKPTQPQVRALHGSSARFRRAQPEFRALGVATEPEVVPEGFWPELQRAMLQFGGMIGVSRVLTTQTGNDLPVTTTNGTAIKGEIVGENVEVGEQDETFDQITLKAFKYTSKIIRVSAEFLEDAFFDVEGYIASIVGERIGRIRNQHYTTGAGTTQPKGAITAATLGKTTASATAIAFGELIDLEHSVDAAYRNGPQVRFMFHDLILAALKKLGVGTGDARPLWQPGVAVGAPDTIDGYRYTINNDMDSTVAADKKTILFGDFSKYWIREVGSIRLLRLAERFAEFDQIGFIAFMRSDANLIDAGTGPVKFLQQHS